MTAVAAGMLVVRQVCSLYRRFLIPRYREDASHLAGLARSHPVPGFATMPPPDVTGVQRAARSGSPLVPESLRSRWSAPGQSLPCRDHTVRDSSRLNRLAASD